MLCADLVEVCWSDKTGRPYSAIANMEEVSQHRAHFVLDEAVPLDTDLVLRMKPGDIIATVRDCRHEPDFGFEVVVQLPNKFRWKPHPRHLFDPRGLPRRKALENLPPFDGSPAVAHKPETETSQLPGLLTR